MKITEIKPFIPSGEEYESARRFFLDLGCVEKWSADGLCELQLGDSAFILQRFANTELQQNLMMQITVDDLAGWYEHVISTGVVDAYEGVRVTEPKTFPWGDTEVHLIDPAGVCWHFKEP